ncbi:MAG: TetR/AcrR family transcriptional regulator [Chlamydiales bacterium]|nr:TetR/AcrR family transcriptional regulator [Chlamydiales bacterium]
MSNPKKRSYVSAARSKQARQTRNQILSSAKKLFQSKGFEEVTIGELAESANVSSPTIYSLFKSKRGVLLALIDEALPSSVFESLVDEVSQEKTAAGRFRIAAKMTRLIYDAEQKQMGLLRGASILGSEFQKIEKEQEQRRYQRQKDTVDTMLEEGLLAEGMTTSEARDVLWAFTGRDMYRLFVVTRKWSSNQYEVWLSRALTKLLSKEQP